MKPRTVTAIDPFHFSFPKPVFDSSKGFPI
jgi:hypothetical protein